jgi:uncharacterized protein YjaG (DUF416 family)
MHSFDENLLVDELERLSSKSQIAFAAAAATRQLTNYERFARDLDISNGQRPREIATELWTDLQAGTIDSALWSARLDEVMGLLPEESDDWVIGHALADDALSSLAYSTRCLLSLKPQEAAWAARRAYEAADQAAICALGIQPGLPHTEAAIKSHEIVQRELSRQRRDLALLSVESIGEVQRQAFEDKFLTEEEHGRLE